MNSVKKICLIMLIVFSCSLLLNGCGKNEYKEFTEKFNNTYLDIVNSVDTIDTIGTLKNIQSKENKSKIEELGVLLDNIENKVPRNKKDEYERYVDWHKGLIILRDTPYSEWEKLTFEQKSNVWGEIILLNISKK
ncbi:hypothetical protein [Wukongibacter sp. M2B1]|uniref:hypothetical protein n=1 Tax=Wukongibacter sp. M2B1 TaxID=3088895 RepID=UPI003D7AF214